MRAFSIKLDEFESLSDLITVRIHSINDFCLRIIFKINVTGFELFGYLCHIICQILEYCIVKLMFLLKVIDHIRQIFNFWMASISIKSKLQKLCQYLDNQEPLPHVLDLRGKLIGIFNFRLNWARFQNIR